MKIYGKFCSGFRDRKDVRSDFDRRPPVASRYAERPVSTRALTPVREAPARSVVPMWERRHEREARDRDHYREKVS